MSAKLPPQKKKRPYGIAISREKRSEIQNFCDLTGTTFSQYLNKLADEDKPNRIRQVAKIKELHAKNPEMFK